MTKECKQQFTLRITQANSTEMIVILYEMLLCYLKECEEALQANDRKELSESARKARGCLNELMQSLHMEYEPARELMQLYLFCVRRLARAEQKADVSMIEDVCKVIRPLRDAYEQIAGQNTGGAVMQNSQTVYAGLTYGRNTLTENMADQGTNRGMLA